MQSNALRSYGSSSSISITKSTRRVSTPFNPHAVVSVVSFPSRSSSSLLFTSPYSSHATLSHSSYSSSTRFPSTPLNGWLTTSSPVLPDPESDDGFQIHAAAENAAAGEIEASSSSTLANTLQLALLFVLWFLFNIYFNIYNKQVLKVYPFPITVSTVQFAVGTLLVIIMWTFKLYKRPKISGAQLAAILPLALVHTLGNLFTNLSLGKVSVSFTHTVKAMEPFFSVVLSAMFLGETPTPLIVISLLPIVGGIALASMTEVSFNWIGFWSAMASNLTNQSRNVLSKKFMAKKEVVNKALARNPWITLLFSLSLQSCRSSCVLQLVF